MLNLTDLLQKIGETLHTIRNAKKQTLQTVAAAIGITHPVLSKIENGRHDHLSVSILVELCNYYSVSLQQIMGFEDISIFQLLEHQRVQGQSE